MAAGVYNSSKLPSGPLYEINIYKMTPTATGGKLIKELKMIVIKFFPINLFIESNEAIGRDMNTDIINAEKDTYKDRPIISRRYESRVNNKSSES
tara:strand:+ start:1600 stop:1884 length:285 start_codon:yes stop_codon:yes gene_type:complete